MDIRELKKPSKAHVETTTDEQALGLITPAEAPMESQVPEGAQASEDAEVPPIDVIEEYRKYLHENDISDEDIFSVLDAIITEGAVNWGFQLLDRIPVTFRMRPAWVNDIVTKQIELEDPKTVSRFSALVSTWNLAGSLAKFKDQAFPLGTPEDIFQVKDFLDKLSFIIQEKLVQQLAIFDRVVAVATSDWAVENFSKPR